VRHRSAFIVDLVRCLHYPSQACSSLKSLRVLLSVLPSTIFTTSVDTDRANRFRMGGRSRPRAGAYDDVTVVRVGAREDGTGGELVAAVETNGSVDVLTGRTTATDTGEYARRQTTISRANLDWGAGSMQHDLQTMSMKPQPQRRPPAGGRVVPASLRAEQKVSGAPGPAEPPPTYGRKRTGP
jgi:hypothetical protein